ncbi:NUDIX domain-containing protein [Robiginitalea sp. M366]|uniref:NUDIX hydrolase n=1 Tax=Robiginitalea aestuariiviva TaxID=3036903 RepID=UPI00240E277C|nr:NUDIX domain-containing protein [Robiginitalea aestuariiviva]MDG1570739.1 NUDIX domain-containing protein [Robiginitalea aestuariiviva]
MYKVFVNERPLILTDKIMDAGEGEYFKMNGKAVKSAVDALFKKKLERAYIYHPNLEEILNKFTAEIPMIVAAGGVVTNASGKVLFIYRNDKWDLPKGVCKKKEKLEDCALREVEEETGVQGLEIENFLRTTYHVLKRGGKYRLKEVHWYAMRTTYDGPLKGQKSEGIEKVKWKGPKKIQAALEQSYINIRILFEPPAL